MPHPDRERLTLVALGEQPVVDALSAHLDQCAQCRSEVTAMRDTVALAREAGPAPLEAPPDHVWSSIAAELALDGRPCARPRPPGPAVATTSGPRRRRAGGGRRTRRRGGDRGRRCVHRGPARDGADRVRLPVRVRGRTARCHRAGQRRRGRRRAAHRGERDDAAGPGAGLLRGLAARRAHQQHDRDRRPRRERARHLHDARGPGHDRLLRRRRLRRALRRRSRPTRRACCAGTLSS